MEKPQEYTMMQQMWKPVWQFPKKSNTELLYNLAVLFLDLHSMEHSVEQKRHHSKTRTEMYTAVLFRAAKQCGNNPSVHQPMNGKTKWGLSMWWNITWQ